MYRWVRASIVVAFALAMYSGEASAQYPGSFQNNTQFDQQFNQQLQSRMMQNQMGQQQLLQNYIAAYGPQLRVEYQRYIQQTGMRVSFEQFAYSYMMTMGGTNPGPALEQQRRNFEATQNANRTVQQGYADYNNGWSNNQQQLGRSFNRYDQQAVRGNQYYQNPATGQVTELPYGAAPGVYQNNQGTWAADPSGQYHQIDPHGYTQRMQPVEPPDDDIQ